MMKNYLLSVAIGDIAGSAYEFSNRTKQVDAVNLLHPLRDYTDDTVCTFAVAEALLNRADIGENLARRCLADPDRGYGCRFGQWLQSSQRKPYNSFGNGSAMRCAAAGFMVRTQGECIRMAELTALPTHNHSEGIKGAKATAEAIYHLMNGGKKDEIRTYIMEKYYPEYADKTYADIQPAYYFDETCQLTVPAALICFLASESYEHCLRLAIALGGDADTLAAIAGPVAYAFYRTMPEELVQAAKALLPEWMLEVSRRFDEHMATINTTGYHDFFDYISKGFETYINQQKSQLQDGFSAEQNKPQPSDRVTPNMVRSMKENEIFVFGSNLQGAHGGGAARQAYNCFGAVWGEGVGHFGQTYAIPTMHGGPDKIQPYVSDFIAYARQHPEWRFLVTRIGCGIAGFRDAEIAPLFREAMDVENIFLPRGFWKELLGRDV